MFTYGKLNLLLINGINLVFSYLEMQRRFIETNLYKFFHSVWKGTAHKPSKVTTAEYFFPSVYVIGTACFEECFLFRVIIGRHYFLYQFTITQKFSAIAMLLCSLKQVLWKKSIFYVRYLYNNITMLLIPKVQSKASTS